MTQLTMTMDDLFGHRSYPVPDRQQRWDLSFLEDADHVARRSKDRSRKVGCVIVNDRHTDLVRGWNGFPRGVNDDVDSRHDRPAKYRFTEHAERNAIYNAAAEGIALKGTTLYSTLYPCTDCARAIIQSGIKRVCTYEPSWDDEKLAVFNFRDSEAMFAEAGIVVDYVSPSGQYDFHDKLTPV